MYTIILNEGIVLRDADQVVVSPADSTDNLDFIAYQTWVSQGNEPLILESREV